MKIKIEQRREYEIFATNAIKRAVTNNNAHAIILALVMQAFDDGMKYALHDLSLEVMR